MADNVNDEKVWASTNSNITHFHAFSVRDGELRAMCRKTIRPHDSVEDESELCSKNYWRKSWRIRSSFCDRCYDKVAAMVDRRNASMEPAQERHDAGYVAPVDDHEETTTQERHGAGYVVAVQTTAGEEPEDWASTATRGMYTHRFGPDGRALCNRRYRAYDRFVSDTDRRVRRTRSEIENGKYGHLYTFCPACSVIPWGDSECEDRSAEGPVESPVREGQEFVHVEDGSRAVVKRVTDSLGSSEPIVWCTLSRESQEHRAQIPRTIFLSSYRPLFEENQQ